MRGADTFTEGLGKPSRKLVNRYTDDFKLKAVALSNEPGALINDVADSLRVHPGMLSQDLRDPCTAKAFLARSMPTAIMFSAIPF